VTVDRVALGWVALYTRGLPAATARTRRAEIESDIWEQRAAAGGGMRVELAVASRTARGVTADLSWRRTQRRGRRVPSLATAVRALGWAFALIAYTLLVCQFTWAATALVGLDLYGADWAPGDVEWYSRACGTLLLVLLSGAALLPRWPRTGAALVASGVAVPPIVFWWAAPLYVPVAVALAAAAITLARRRRQTLQARASSATN
jgi:hypothetical protein